MSQAADLGGPLAGTRRKDKALYSEGRVSAIETRRVEMVRVLVPIHRGRSD